MHEPSPAHPALNQLGASPLRRRPVPGSTASYAIELIPANGRSQCDANDATGSMIVAAGGPMSGTFSIRSDGFSNGIRRTIVATFRRRSFLDYLYFTDLETSDPAWYVLSANGRADAQRRLQQQQKHVRAFDERRTCCRGPRSACPRYWRNGRSSQGYPVAPDDGWQQQNLDGTWPSAGSTITSTVRCTEIQFVSADHIDGPLHTNDDILVCGNADVRPHEPGLDRGLRQRLAPELLGLAEHPRRRGSRSRPC